MSQTKKFHIGTILSITDGKLISPDHIGGVYEICDWMTGEANFTHQLPRVSREIEPSLREQFPDLAKVVVPDAIDSMEKVLDFLASLEPQYGTHRDVAQMDKADHTSIDPIAEIEMMRPDAKIIGI